MSDIINLKRARKQKARAEKDAKASANRAKFGRTKAERLKLANAKERRDTALDGKRLDLAPKRTVD